MGSSQQKFATRHGKPDPNAPFAVGGSPFHQTRLPSTLPHLIRSPVPSFKPREETGDVEAFWQVLPLSGALPVLADCEIALQTFLLQTK